MVLAPSNPDYIYLATGNKCHWCLGNGIWRSTDGGETWEHPESEILGVSVMSLAVHPGNPTTLLAGIGMGTNIGGGIYRSTDSGDYWQPTLGLEDFDERVVNDIVYDLKNQEIVYAATQGGLRVCLDDGLSWMPYPGPMGQIPTTVLAVFPDGQNSRIYLGTVDGMLVGGVMTRQIDQSDTVLGAGVYLGHTYQWEFIYIPLVLRGSD